jgi:hypothetical protein
LCFIPPDCLFCRHYYRDGPAEGPDCAAFDEIPDPVFRGELGHLDPLPGDRGLRFELDPELADEYAEVAALRAEIQAQAGSEGAPDPDP